jgi:hypothetical protein
VPVDVIDAGRKLDAWLRRVLPRCSVPSLSTTRFSGPEVGERPW